MNTRLSVVIEQLIQVYNCCIIIMMLNTVSYFIEPSMTPLEKTFFKLKTARLYISLRSCIYLNLSIASSLIPGGDRK